MKFYKIFAILVVLVFSGCTQRSVPKPKPLLSEKKMVELLTEMHLIEMLIQQTQTAIHHNPDSVLIHTSIAYSELFERFGLNKETFEANLNYRSYFSRDLERIYTKVHTNLHRLDSIRNQVTIPSELEL